MHEGATGAAHGGPMVVVTFATVCVKNCPPVAPVKPKKAFGPSFAPRLIVRTDDDTSPAPDSPCTRRAHTHGSYESVSLSPSLQLAAHVEERPDAVTIHVPLLSTSCPTMPGASL